MDISETEAAVTSQLPSGFIYPKKYASGTHRVWLKNLITNGDFLKSSPWYANGGNASLNNNKFVNTVNLKVSYDSIYQYIQDYKAIIKDHVYYGFFIVKISVASSDCYALLNDGTSSLRGPYTAVAKDTPTLIPFYFKVLNDGNDKARFLVYPSSVGINAGEKITGHYSILIDLTASYGAGNEPSKAHMDALLMANFPDTQGWFDGNAAVYDFDDQTATSIAPLLDPITTTNRTFTIEGTKPVQVTNLVENGNFATATGWTRENATMSVVSNEATVLASSIYGQIFQRILGLSNHKYYYSINTKATSSLVHIRLTPTPNESASIIEIASNRSGTYESISGIADFTSATLLTGVDFVIFDSRSSGYDNFYVKNVTLIDLTSAFGAGNEPTKAQMDAWLNSQFPDSNGWFDGTNTILTNTSASSVSNNSYLTDLKLKGNTILDASNETRLPITGYNNITNNFINSSFASTASWCANYGTLTVSNNVMIFTPTGDGTYGGISQNSDAFGTHILGHKYYCAAMIAIADFTNIIAIRIYGVGGQMENFPISGKTPGTFYRISAIRECTDSTFYTIFQPSQNIGANYPATAVVSLKHPVLIDLTASYGAGNEPTKDQMDEILATRLYPTTDGWFDGTNSKIVNSPDSGIYESIIGRCDKPFKTTRNFVSPYSQGEQISDNTFGMGLYWITKDHYYLAVIKESTSGSNHFNYVSNGNSGNIKGGTLTYDSADKIAYGLMTGLSNGYDNITFSYSYSADDDMVAEWIVVMDITKYGFAPADYGMAYNFFKNIGFTNLARGLKLGKPRGDVFANYLGSQNVKTSNLSCTGSGYYLSPKLDGSFIFTGNVSETQSLKFVYATTGHKYFICFNTSGLSSSNIFAVVLFTSGFALAGSGTAIFSGGYIYGISTATKTAPSLMILNSSTAITGAICEGEIVIDLTAAGYSSYTADQFFTLIRPYISGLFKGNIINLQPDTRSIGDRKSNIIDLSTINDGILNRTTDTTGYIDSSSGIFHSEFVADAASNTSAYTRTKNIAISSLGLKEGDTIVIGGRFSGRSYSGVTCTFGMIYNNSAYSYISESNKTVSSASLSSYYATSWMTTIPSGTVYISLFLRSGNYSNESRKGDFVDMRDIAISVINKGEPGTYSDRIAYPGKHSDRSLRISNSPINHLDINKLNKIATSVNPHYIDSSYYNPIGYMTIKNTEATSTNSYILYKVNLSDIGIDPGKAYVFSINLRSFSNLTGTTQTGIQIKFYDSNGTALTPYMNIFSGYANRLRYYVIPSGAYSMDVVFRINSSDSSAMAVGARAVFDKLFIGSYDTDYEPARRTDYYDVNLKTSLSRAWQNNETLMKADQVMSVYDTLDYSRCYSYKITASRDYSTNWTVSSTGLLGSYMDDPIWSVIDESTESIIESSSGETNALTPIKAGTKDGISTSSTGRVNGHQANPDKTYLTGGIVGGLNYSYIWHERDYMPDIKLYPDTTNIITIEDDNGLAPSEISYRYLANGEA